MNRKIAELLDKIVLEAAARILFLRFNVIGVGVARAERGTRPGRTAWRAQTNNGATNVTTRHACEQLEQAHTYLAELTARYDLIAEVENDDGPGQHREGGPAS